MTTMKLMITDAVPEIIYSNKVIIEDPVFEYSAQVVKGNGDPDICQGAQHVIVYDGEQAIYLDRDMALKIAAAIKAVFWHD